MTFSGVSGGTLTAGLGLNSDVSTGANTEGFTFSNFSTCLLSETKVGIASGFVVVSAPFFRGILCKYPNPISQPVSRPKIYEFCS